jgi:hypothetical protein
MDARRVVFSSRIGGWTIRVRGGRCFGSFELFRDALAVARLDVLPSLPELVDRSITQFVLPDEFLDLG